MDYTILFDLKNSSLVTKRGDVTISCRDIYYDIKQHMEFCISDIDFSSEITKISNTYFDDIDFSSKITKISNTYFDADKIGLLHAELYIVFPNIFDRYTRRISLIYDISYNGNLSLRRFYNRHVDISAKLQAAVYHDNIGLPNHDIKIEDLYTGMLHSIELPDVPPSSCMTSCDATFADDDTLIITVDKNVCICKLSGRDDFVFYEYRRLYFYHNGIHGIIDDQLYYWSASTLCMIDLINYDTQYFTNLPALCNSLVRVYNSDNYIGDTCNGQIILNIRNRALVDTKEEELKNLVKEIKHSVTFKVPAYLLEMINYRIGDYLYRIMPVVVIDFILEYYH